MSWALYALTIAWIGGTFVLLVVALRAHPACFQDCNLTRGQQIHRDHLLIASAVCAALCPLLASVVCLVTDRATGFAIFLILGVCSTLLFAVPVGGSGVHDLRRMAPPSVQRPLYTHCVCISGEP